MTDIHGKIFPRIPKLPAEFPHPSVGAHIGLGFVLWFALYLGPGLMLEAIGVPGNTAAALAFLSATGLSIPLTILLYLRKRRRLRAEHVATLEAASRKEAESTTAQVTSLAATSQTAVASLPLLVDQAGEELTRARSEYAENAFAPFWDAVERATHRIATYREIVSTINSQAVQYYEVLQDRSHSFGHFPIRTEDLPTLTPILDDYQKVVRLGQTNFHFATIYEQRKTREVLIRGFKTLGEAIENMGYAVTQSIDELGNTTRNGLAAISAKVEDLAAHEGQVVAELRSQTAKLDNLQRGRKPPLIGD